MVVRRAGMHEVPSLSQRGSTLSGLRGPLFVELPERCDVESATESADDILLFLYIQGGAVQVSKWGNSLAIRLPAVVVEALGLKEGDQIEVRVAGTREFEVGRDQSREQALERLRKMRWKFPPGFKFDREEANER